MDWYRFLPWRLILNHLSVDLFMQDFRPIRKIHEPIITRKRYRVFEHRVWRTAKAYWLIKRLLYFGQIQMHKTCHVN